MKECPHKQHEGNPLAGPMRYRLSWDVTVYHCEWWKRQGSNVSREFRMTSLSNACNFSCSRWNRCRASNLMRFSPTFSFVVTMLSSDLQMDMNFCISLTTYLHVRVSYINNLQMENTQNSSSTSKQKRLTIIHMSRKFLMQVYLPWQPADSHKKIGGN